MDYFVKPAHKILNLGEIQKSAEKIVSSQIAYQINKSILRLYGKFLNEDGTHVDYQGMKNSEEFKQFRMDTIRLQEVDLESLQENERKCLFLNLYNSLLIHSYVENGVPQGGLTKTNFFRETSYKIGNHIFALDDMEHGILRGNAKHPAFFFFKLPFSDDDPRKKFILKCDPRVHFALVCGAKSCPPVRLYTPENLENGLNAALVAFCSSESNLKIEESAKKVHLSQIFKWYRSDFAESEEGLLKWLSERLPDTHANQLRDAISKHFSVNYIPYDWSVNGSH